MTFITTRLRPKWHRFQRNFLNGVLILIVPLLLVFERASKKDLLLIYLKEKTFWLFLQLVWIEFNPWKFVLAKVMDESYVGCYSGRPSSLVIVPLRSIIEEQINANVFDLEVKGFSFSKEVLGASARKIPLRGIRGCYWMIPLVPRWKPKCLGSGGSMVAKLKL